MIRAELTSVFWSNKLWKNCYFDKCRVCIPEPWKQRALETVILTSVEFVYPSRRRGIQLHKSKLQFLKQVAFKARFTTTRVKITIFPKRVALKHTSEFPSTQNWSRINELFPSIQCMLFYCLPYLELYHYKYVCVPPKENIYSYVSTMKKIKRNNWSISSE